MNRVVFLDYDGVVNGLLWAEYSDGFKARWAYPCDGFVNNYQAICWLNRLYEVYPYDIVVTSTWKSDPNYAECLYNGHLNRDIHIDRVSDYENHNRIGAINEYLKEHPEITSYVILDDIRSYYARGNAHDFDRVVITDEDIGFQFDAYTEACRIFKTDLEGEKNV